MALRRNSHAVKAAMGLGASFAFLMIPTVGIFFDPYRKLGWPWLILFLSTMLAVGWGAAHLAQARGYPSGGGCGLCIVGYIVSGLLGTRSEEHTSELQSHSFISYAVFCLKK